MAIRIGNLRDLKLREGEVLVKVDRSSCLGNPFHMQNEFYRDTVCNQYEKWFEDKKDSNPLVVKEMHRICELAKKNDVVLGCWCAPKRCHAETIKRELEEMLLYAEGRAR